MIITLSIFILPAYSLDLEFILECSTWYESYLLTSKSDFILVWGKGAIDCYDMLDSWAERLFLWHNDDLISDWDLIQAISYVKGFPVSQPDKSDSVFSTPEFPPPTNLGLPYGMSDLDLEHGASHPLGVLRFVKDKQPHPGIDLQLYDGAKILAMGDGSIQKISKEGSFPGDMGIILQIEETLWGVNYEHFIPDADLYVGKKISKGEQIGIFSGGYTEIPASIHIDFRYYPDGFSGYSGEFVCWVDNLESDGMAELQSAWDNAKVTDEFIEGWSNLVMEGNYIFKGLLDSEKFPDGPQMCYPFGTDVREPVPRPYS